LNPREDEPFALSPEDAEPGAPEALAPGAQALPGAGRETPAQPAPAAGGLKRRIIADPPEIDQKQGRRTAWFLLVLAVAATLMMAAVGAFNTYADPYGLVGTRALPTLTTTDRSIKADYVDRLARPPQLIVLGSSRSARYEPSYLHKKTGLRVFNGGINAVGGIGDAWAMANYIHSRFPGAHPAYLWLVDVESFVPFAVDGRTASEPRLNQYLGGPRTGTHGARAFAEAVWTSRRSLFSWTTAVDSLHVLEHPAAVKKAASKYRTKFLPDGGQVPNPYSAKEFALRFPRSAKRYTDLYKNVYHAPDPQSLRYFQRTLALMNRQGATPIIVLTPINPKLLAIVGPLGWDTRHQQVVRFIDAQHARYRFRFLDLTDIAKFHGDPVQFYDGVHMTELNTRRAIDYVLRQTGGVPR
jgi:hypothetical protein